jgi:hypothetical protein
VFALFDPDNHGKITFRDLKSAAPGPGGGGGGNTGWLACFLSANHAADFLVARRRRVVTELGESISDEEMREMIEEADRDRDGETAHPHHPTHPHHPPTHPRQGTLPSRISSASCARSPTTRWRTWTTTRTSNAAARGCTGR